eukprot:TRINITY_DN36872_c0_g1_i1.p1 TRINITY_DN36872_c0_g1~~TRINITY_DN36872_c0_g1_i1.p1  ORF type:complete len:944 (-),score=165.95 TRINITY_DN36872_c0_g1_i1:92-2923(-)
MPAGNVISGAAKVFTPVLWQHSKPAPRPSPNKAAAARPSLPDAALQQKQMRAGSPLPGAAVRAVPTPAVNASHAPYGSQSPSHPWTTPSTQSTSSMGSRIASGSQSPTRGLGYNLHGVPPASPQSTLHRSTLSASGPLPGITQPRVTLAHSSSANFGQLTGTSPQSSKRGSSGGLHHSDSGKILLTAQPGTPPSMTRPHGGDGIRLSTGAPPRSPQGVLRVVASSGKSQLGHSDSGRLTAGVQPGPPQDAVRPFVGSSSGHLSHSDSGRISIQPGSPQAVNSYGSGRLSHSSSGSLFGMGLQQGVLPRTPVPGRHRPRRHSAPADAAKAEEEAEARALYASIDADGDGFVSKLEFVAAMQRDSDLAAELLPGVDCSQLLSDERSFDQADALFNSIAGQKRRLDFATFVAHISKASASGRQEPPSEVRRVFDLIDADGDGAISKLELVTAVSKIPEVAKLVLSEEHLRDEVGLKVMADESCYDAVDAIFVAMACGRKRIGFSDFQEHFHRTRPSLGRSSRSLAVPQRSQERVLLIGFDQPAHLCWEASLTAAGFQSHRVDLPTPQAHLVATYLPHLKAAIEDFKPTAIACASHGGVYVAALWEAGLWMGPTLMLNVHPSVSHVPGDVPVVIAAGVKDEVFRNSREELERLVSTANGNKCLLYISAGDRHLMDSILHNDCLPRLLDATLCSEECPEASLIRSWKANLPRERLEAEEWLGYTPDSIFKHWTVAPSSNTSSTRLVQLPAITEEFSRVAAIFKAAPASPSYEAGPRGQWEQRQVVKVERVENGRQALGSAVPYLAALRRSVKEQSLEFEPGVHTVWAFHGTDAIEHIITNPVSGFNPFASGTCRQAAWGLGTYFARDARYVAEGHFCGPAAADGTRRMLMCLLMTGIPCLGDPRHNGVLPFRSRPHRYDSSVDCLSNPELYILPHPGAALPAYIITFA